MIREIIKTDIGQIVGLAKYHSVVEYNMEKVIERPKYNQNYRGDFQKRNFRGNLRSNQNYIGQNYRDGNRRNYRNNNYERGRK